MNISAQSNGAPQFEQTDGCTQGGHLVGWLDARVRALCALFVSFRFIFNHQLVCGLWLLCRIA